jgi:hypothetical protein
MRREATHARTRHTNKTKTSRRRRRREDENKKHHQYFEMRVFQLLSRQVVLVRDAEPSVNILPLLVGGCKLLVEGFCEDAKGITTIQYNFLARNN